MNIGCCYCYNYSEALTLLWKGKVGNGTFLYRAYWSVGTLEMRSYLHSKHDLPLPTEGGFWGPESFALALHYDWFISECLGFFPYVTMYSSQLQIPLTDKWEASLSRHLKLLTIFRDEDGPNKKGQAYGLHGIITQQDFYCANAWSDPRTPSSLTLRLKSW